MIEFVLLAVGAVAGVFLRYLIVASPKTVGGLPVNVLAVNIIGSFILGLFSVVFACFKFGFKLHVACGYWVLWNVHNHVIFCS
jgi:CrcB protein